MRLLTRTTLGLCALALGALLPGCKTEENRPTYQQQAQVPSRVKAVQQAERQRWEAEQQAAREDAARAAAEQAAGTQAPAGESGTPAAPAAAPSPGYLPPSEQGADVRVTETPVGGAAASPAPDAGSAGTAGQGSASPPAAGSGGTGGRVPAGGGAGTAAGADGQAPAAAASSAGQAAPAGSVENGLTATAPRTSAEQAAALNQDLQRKLQEFDAMMRKAQENAARERAAASAAGETATDGRGGLLEEPPDGGAGGRAGRATGLGSTPDLSGETGAAPRQRAGRTEVALPEGSDDDIVARQLREAAERETDPVLKKKLWEEYRNYKGGL
ncbi:MAG: hypothetical protein AB7O21_13625 [Gammaproteobacteria bacterium]